jgi:2,4-dienoyl-CoA reductase (NADPH2)
VEIMGSEGYLINEFIAAHTNHRDDEWGGSYENRIRFPLEIVRRTRERVGTNFIIIFRLSMLDLVEGGSTTRRGGATGAGAGGRRRHHPEHRHRLARGPHSHHCHQGAACRVCLGDAAAQGQGGHPAGGHQPHQHARGGREVLAEGKADMVSMARPFLADPDFVAKAAKGKADEINTCIGCNQACLDHTFGGKITSCLVNPRACHETMLVSRPLPMPRQERAHRRGGCRPGRAGLCDEAARRGFDVTLFDAASEIGGQFNVAKQVPGKEEFYETLRYFGKQIELTGVKLQLGRASAPRTWHRRLQAGGAGHRRHPAHCPTSRASTTPRCWATWTCCATRSRWARRWR